MNPLHAWVYETVLNHSNSIDGESGLSCEERGCDICNSDSKEIAAALWIQKFEDGPPYSYGGPRSVEEAWQSLIWWNHGGKDEWFNEVWAMQ